MRTDNSAKYTISRKTGRIEPARQVASQNCDARPNRSDPTLIVLHGISLPPGEYGGSQIEALFTNQLDCGEHPYFEALDGLRVSAHCLIRRDGTLVQFVPFTERSWHAGLSCYRGQDQCNDYSIGIELEGEDESPYDDRQYETLIGVVSALLQSYPDMNARTIAAHSDIAPERKTDPGPAFDWLRLYDGLA